MGVAVPLAMQFAGTVAGTLRRRPSAVVCLGGSVPMPIAPREVLSRNLWLRATTVPAVFITSHAFQVSASGQRAACPLQPKAITPMPEEANGNETRKH